MKDAFIYANDKDTHLSVNVNIRLLCSGGEKDDDDDDWTDWDK